MCGIAGWAAYSHDLYDEDEIMDKVSRTLAPRGPDSSGVFKDNRCFLAHRRLIVIDPENGVQPMSCHFGGKQYTLCYNGELYNTGELRARLEVLGHSFRGHSDTEVLLCAYIAWGERCLDELNGIYAFAVWDGARLFLARDRAGVKPLFYYHYDGGIIFASEIKALLAHPYVKPIIDREGIASLMLLGPSRRGGCGVIKGISELKPAQCAFFDGTGLAIRDYWRLRAREHTEDLEETAAHVRELITDSVERQLISDVPLCTFLSGGLDSSIISAISAKKYKSEGRVLTTYSIDYANNRCNFRPSAFQPDEDAPWIERMAGVIGSEHRSFITDTPQLTGALFDAVIARDLPGMADVDSSLLLFCAEVKREFTVAVSGECADEIFGGYPWYHKDEILFAQGYPWARATTERASLLKDGILGDIDADEFVNADCRSVISQTDYLDSDSPRERRMREMFMLNFYRFMQVLLDRKDRMSMASGLEVRVPFCDHRIAEYAYNIPWAYKSYNWREKGIVRYAMRGLLPDDVLWRKKSPYPKTHNPDYMRLLLTMMNEVLTVPDCRLYELLDRDKLRALVDTQGEEFTQNWYGQLMCAPQMFAYLLQLEYWLRKYNVEIQKD